MPRRCESDLCASELLKIIIYSTSSRQASVLGGAGNSKTSNTFYFLLLDSKERVYVSYRKLCKRGYSAKAHAVYSSIMPKPLTQ